MQRELKQAQVGAGGRGPQVLQHNQNCLKHVYTKQYYPATPSICTNGPVHTSSLLHANDVSCEKRKKVLSICIHVHFTLETLVSSAWPFCILDPGCFNVDACTAICSKKPLAGGPWKENVT